MILFNTCTNRMPPCSSFSTLNISSRKDSTMCCVPNEPYRPSLLSPWTFQENLNSESFLRGFQFFNKCQKFNYFSLKPNERKIKMSSKLESRLGWIQRGETGPIGFLYYLTQCKFAYLKMSLSHSVRRQSSQTLCPWNLCPVTIWQRPLFQFLPCASGLSTPYRNI